VQGLLECRNSNGETPFLDALDSCSEKVSKFLFEYGVNVFACDRWGHNALWLACCFADKPFIKSLLALGLDINNQTDAGVDCLYNVLDRDVSDQDELVDLALLLINSGARLSSSGSGQSPLHMACFTGNLAIVKELLNRIDPRELSVESRFTGTPLWAACFRGHLEVVKMLLGTGWEFDINLGKNGESPLEAAAVQLHWEVVTILENSGALRTKELQIRPVKVQPSEIITSVGLGEVEV
jgi:ankyrin repeat protein